MAQSNMGFGQRFQLGQAYSPTLDNANFGQQGMVNLQPTAMGVQGLQMQGKPSLLDVGLAQQQQPGGLVGFGNNTGGMMGVQGGGGTNWAGLAQQGLGLLSQGMGGDSGGEQPQAPPPPGAGILRAPQNDKLQRLLAQYGINSGV